MRPGAVGRGASRHGEAGGVGCGSAWWGRVRHGEAGEVGHVAVGRGMVGQGLVVRRGWAV